MHLRELPITGFFEDQDASSSETLQILAPDSDMDRDLMAWVLLPRPQMVQEDPARRGYAFDYELGEQLDRGLFALSVTGREASGVEHAAEIATAVTLTVPSGGQRVHSFSPFWFFSESLHFKPTERMSHEQYHGAAYGRLHFDGTQTLPHRRLFGATI